MRASTRLIGALAAARGRLAREIGAGIDLVRDVGPAYAARRWHQQRVRASSPAADGDPVYREIWNEAAAEVGAEVVELFDDYLELRRGGKTTRVRRHWVMLDDIVTTSLALDKLAVHRMLAQQGVRVPRHVEFPRNELAAPLRFLEQLRGPAVVKPATGTSSGSGVTSGVRTAEHLVRARLRAARLGDRILIEEQAPGDICRFLYCDGDLLGAVRRRVPHLTGDGSSTIARLVESENERRRSRPGGTLLTIDLDSLLALDAQGFTIRSVPPRGLRFPVKGIASQNAFEDNESLDLAALAPDLVEMGRSAVATVGLRLGGVDLITTDPGRLQAAAEGVVIEVNGTPGLHYHYQVMDPTHAHRVAIPILARALGAKEAGSV